jgi:hypothetical protein
MQLQCLPDALSVCKVASLSHIRLDSDFYFLARTDEELSLVCRTSDAPAATVAREDGWRGFRVVGVLDFSLVGILARLSSLLAENAISIFAVSTYNTDYILVREPQFERAVKILSAAGYEIREGC